MVLGENKGANLSSICMNALESVPLQEALRHRYGGEHFDGGQS